jgi:hypothetical protein
MRLTKRDEELAVSELLDRLKEFPAGLPTKDLIGTRHFHGMRTLTSVQIHRLLRQQPNVKWSWRGSGYYGSSWWQLNL